MHRRVDQELDPQTPGTNVHSTNATIAEPTARAMTRVRARTSGRPEERTGWRAPLTPMRDRRPRLVDEVLHRGGRPLEPRHDVRVRDRVAADADVGRHHDVRGGDAGSAGPTSIGVQRKTTAIRCHRCSAIAGREGREHDQQRRRRHRIGGEVDHVERGGTTVPPRISRFRCTKISYAEPTSIAVDASAISSADARRRHREQPHAEHEQRQRAEQRPREAVVRCQRGR